MDRMKVFVPAPRARACAPRRGAGGAAGVDPRCRMTGTRVTVTSPLPKAKAAVRFGTRVVPLLVEPGLPAELVVLEWRDERVPRSSPRRSRFSRSAVPFVVAGASLVGVQKLVGLREAILTSSATPDPTPEGACAPEQRAKKILSFGDGEHHDRRGAGSRAAPRG